MAALSKFDAIVERTIEKRLVSRIDQKIDEYFASLLELEKGVAVVQVHAGVTRKGLTKAVRKTKVSQLADMEVGKEYFFKTPKGVDVERWADRWSSTITYLQRRTGFKWSTHRDHEQGGAVIVRTR